METLRLVLVAFGLLVAICQAAITNTNYFTFPSKTDDVPLVHTGDTVNVTWLSDYSQAVMYFWCDSGRTKVSENRSLGGDGSLSIVVNSSWTSPCHWQYANQANEAIFVDSGHVRVTNQRATPAVTWVPNESLGTACGIQRTTITNSAGQTITTTQAAPSTTAARGTANASSSSTACAAAADSPQLSSGASIGVGIVVGLGIAGLTAAIWIPMRRRCLRQAQPNYTQDSSQVYLQQHVPKPVEVENQSRSEMDGNARTGFWALSELPATPHNRSSRNIPRNAV